jgi:hypothetical protein
MTEGQH